jgi:hypothetical protein
VALIIKLIDPALPTFIKFVRQYKAKKVIYDVEMFLASDSQSIRDAYGLFWRKKAGKRLPDGLKGLSISNVTTFATRVRVRMLKELCHLHQVANPALSCFVTSYLPRPELKIRDRKGPLTSLTYTKAISKLSHHLTLDFLKELYHYARTNLPEEEVVERFLVLGSDLLCTSSEDLISMSVDEVNTSMPPPVVSAVSPMAQPAVVSTPSSSSVAALPFLASQPSVSQVALPATSFPPLLRPVLLRVYFLHLRPSHKMLLRVPLVPSMMAFL